MVLKVKCWALVGNTPWACGCHTVAVQTLTPQPAPSIQHLNATRAHHRKQTLTSQSWCHQGREAACTGDRTASTGLAQSPDHTRAHLSPLGRLGLGGGSAITSLAGRLGGLLIHPCRSRAPHGCPYPSQGPSEGDTGGAVTEREGQAALAGKDTAQPGRALQALLLWKGVCPEERSCPRRALCFRGAGCLCGATGVALGWQLQVCGCSGLGAAAR